MLIYYYIRLFLIVSKSRKLNKKKKYLESYILCRDFYNHLKNKVNESSFLIRQSTFNIGISCYQLLHYEEALKYFIKVYEIDRRVLNDDNNDIFRDLSLIANTYSKIGKYGKQLNYDKKCYKFRKKKLGEDHPDTLTSLNNLAYSYGNLNYYTKKLECDKQCYILRKKVLGENHPDTLISLNNFRRDMIECEKKQKYYNFRKRELDNIYRMVYPDVFDLELDLLCGFEKKNISNYDKLIEYYKKCYELSKDILGEDHQNTFANLELIASTFANIEDYQRQLKYNEKIYELRKKILGKENPRYTKKSYEFSVVL